MWEDFLREEMATHPRIPDWRNSMDRDWLAAVKDHKGWPQLSDRTTATILAMTWALSTLNFLYYHPLCFLHFSYISIQMLQCFPSNKPCFPRHKLLHMLLVLREMSSSYLSLSSTRISSGLHIETNIVPQRKPCLSLYRSRTVSSIKYPQRVC